MIMFQLVPGFSFAWKGIPFQPDCLDSSTVTVNSDSSIAVYVLAGVTTSQSVRVRLTDSMACSIRSARPAACPTSVSMTDRITLSGWFRAPLT